MLSWTKKIIFLFLLLFSPFSVAAQTAQVEEWMPDSTLRATIIEHLDLPNNILLTKDNMKWIRRLNAGNKGISDITGLEYATQLEVLHIDRNPITDLMPLSDLINLKFLAFWQLPERPIMLDISPLSNLVNLEVLSLHGNGITDFTILSNLTKLRVLHIHDNYATDFSFLMNLPNLVDLRYDEVCNYISAGLPVSERIQNRTYPSVVGFWPEGTIEEVARYDFHYGDTFRIDWNTTETYPTHGVAIQLTSQFLETSRRTHEQLLAQNPDMLFFKELRIINHLQSNAESAFPSNSSYWLRDRNGDIVKNQNGEYIMDILNTELQDILIQRFVAYANCGIFDGVLIDSMAGHGVHASRQADKSDQVIRAYQRIFREVRERVPEDFLIIVNANYTKPVHYAEYINGSSMEPGEDYKGAGGGTYTRLKTLDETLLWNEANCREPIVNWAEFFLYPDQPPDTLDNRRRMRLATARSLTHSDGYVRITYVLGTWRKWMDGHNHWYSFWDTDLGRPVGEKGHLYDEDIEGLFIREFTNGWAVYNRSGAAQSVQLPQSTGVASHKTGSVHIVPDLDGEMFLRVIIDLNGDGVVNILDLVIVVNAFGESEPDLNGDGVINILDLVIVANAL